MAASQRWLRLSLRDTGIGMPDHVLKRALEPYFTTKLGRGGTGLGLASVADYLRAIGGEVTIASEVGGGTEVWLDLPVKAD